MCEREVSPLFQIIIKQNNSPPKSIIGSAIRHNIEDPGGIERSLRSSCSLSVFGRLLNG